MNSIIILGIAQALFLSLLILNKKNRGSSDKHLIVLLIFYAFHLAFFYFNFSYTFSIGKASLIIGSGLPLLGGPILLWYVNSLIKGGNRLVTYIIHSLPFFIYCISFLYFLSFTDWRLEVYDGFMHFDENLPWVFQKYSVFFALSGGLYPTACIFLIIDHKKNIHRAFSYEEQINLIWLRNILLFAIGAFVVTFCAIYFILSKYIDFDPADAFKITAGMLTLYVFLLGYFGLKQTSLFTGALEMSTLTKSKYETGLTSDKSSKYLETIDAFMANEKPYYNGKLTIRELSEKIGISSNHLSQAINENLGVNFFDYVNRFRVEDVKKKINDPAFSHFSILGIALDAGFNSKSSFNQIFKKFTGVTPSQFKKQNS